MELKLILLIVSLFASAFFSGAETAFISVSFIEIQVWLRNKLWGTKWLHYLSSKPERYLITTLIGTNIAVVTFSSFSTYFFESHINHFLLLLINSFFLLIFGEIIPKTIFRELAKKIIRYIALPVVLFRWFFFPIYILVATVINTILRIIGQKKVNITQFFTKKDLEILLRESIRVGIVAPSESKIMIRVFRLSHRKVREIMIPRTEMQTVGYNDTLENVRAVFKKTGYSKLPVIGEDLDDIRGAVFIKDLLNNPKTLGEIIREVMFVPQSMLCFRLLKKMQSQHVSLAIALDEYGGTAGLVTMEDLVEELFGEIADEYDADMIRIKKIGRNTILASARAEVHLVNDKMNWELPLGNYETVGGMVLEKLGRIPRKSEKVQIGEYEITILGADNRRIRFVKIQRFPLKRSEQHSLEN